MTVRFAPEAAKRELTPVDNLFLAEYMPDADGNAVKVYLFGLMQCLYPAYRDSDMALTLRLSEADILSAYVYWQSRGLVKILGEAPLIVEYLTVLQPAASTAVPVKYTGFVSALRELIAPREFTLREMGHIYDCLETFRLEEGAVLELVSYCMEQKGRNVSVQYIVTLARDWAEKDILTASAAAEHLRSLKIKKHGAGEVLRRWSKRRPPTVDEMALYDKWVKEWGFDEEAILAVCPQLTSVSTPTFEILDERLDALRRQGLRRKEDIEKKAEDAFDDKEFARMVFARMGKVEPPTPTNAAQISAFLTGERPLTRELILLAADNCRDADRPFGRLKTLLKDWSERGIHTLAEGEQALAAPAARTPSRRRQTPYAGFDQRNENINIDDIALDLDSDLV